MVGYTTLTVEAHAAQTKLLEIGEVCHIHFNGPAQRVAAQIELFEFYERRK